MPCPSLSHPRLTLYGTWWLLDTFRVAPWMTVTELTACSISLVEETSKYTQVTLLVYLNTLTKVNKLTAEWSGTSLLNWLIDHSGLTDGPRCAFRLLEETSWASMWSADMQWHTFLPNLELTRDMCMCSLLLAVLSWLTYWANAVENRQNTLITKPY